jgi:RimJ/RimL family protein N-acetyltransferase
LSVIVRHDLTIEGAGYRLRPITVDDAEFVANIRTSEQAHVRFLHPVTPDIAAQASWLEAYLERPGDYYWVIERRDTESSEGLIGLYDINEATRSAEWGRWILRRGSLAAVESALLVYQSAFENLALRRVYCVTIAENHAVVSFHDSCGLRRVAELSGHLELGGRRLDAIRHECAAGEWPPLRDRLKPQAALIARRLQRRAPT